MSSAELTVDQRQSLLASIDARIAALNAAVDAALNQSARPQVISLPNHFEETDDAAIASLELATEVAAVERDANELRELLRARARMGTEQAGHCDDCGALIPWARLAVVPEASRCVSCQGAYERGLGTPHFSRL